MTGSLRTPQLVHIHPQAFALTSDFPLTMSESSPDAEGVRTWICSVDWVSKADVRCFHSEQNKRCHQLNPLLVS